jgi:solute carrier family 10 (sodium/bile acid cotransporter), member 7
MKTKIGNLLTRVGLNGFLLGIFGAIGLASVFPDFGSAGSGIPWKPFIQVGIAFLFFFYGLKLDPNQLRVGLSNWRLHTVVQLTTFLVFPLLVMGTVSFIPGLNPNFILGIQYLGALPSTVSASVVLVSIAGGNVASAIFNASISSLLGVVLTPLWMQFAGGEVSGQLDLWVSIVDLSFKVVLPVLLGLILHRYLFPKIKPYLNRLKYLDQTVILSIVFTTFSESFSQNIFVSFSWKVLGGLALLMGILLLLVAVILFLLGRMLSFPKEDQLVALFCGSTKSLVHGVAMGKVLFPSAALLGLVLLPVMLYHLQQLILGSILAKYFEKKKP